MSEWQPIETAPKDNVDVLLFCGDRIVVGMFCTEFETVDYDEDNDDAIYRSAWTAFHVSSWGLEQYREETPTHWMPLPEPPK